LSVLIHREEKMSQFKELFGSLSQKRDELKVQIHLGSMEAKDQWGVLEKKWEKFAARASKEIDEGSKVLADELDALGDEIAEGYESIKNKLL
jgi:hypothetical protein